MSSARYFVCFAPNHHGDEGTKVLSVHRTYPNALKRIESTTTLCVRYDALGHVRRGQALNANTVDGHFPLATGDES